MDQVIAPSEAENIDSRKNVYIFILHTMQIGGVESLAVRMANSLVNLGETVYFFCPEGPMVNSLNANILIRCFESEFILNDALQRTIFPDQKFHANIWVSLPSFIFRNYWFSAHLWKKYQATSSVVSGIFHPEQIRKASPFSLLYYKTILMALILPRGSVYFMNDGCKSSTRNNWGSIFDNWPIHNLYLGRNPDFNLWNTRKAECLRIVSVGRLVKFKSYNYASIQTVIDLRNRGISATWDIYGDGPDKDLLESEVIAAGLDSVIHFRGSIPYSELTQTIREYDIFVGMGTAAIEAAQIGMPTVLAIVSSNDETYGFLSEAPSDSVGEKIAGAKTMRLIEVLDFYNRASDQDRLRIGRACQLDAPNRSNGEGPPFRKMFSSGLHFPPQRRSLRSVVLAALRHFLLAKKHHRLIS